MSNTVAVLMRKAPYGTVYTAEGFRTMMGVAVFEMDISVVFDVEKFYVHDESLAERGLTPDDLVMDVEVVNSVQVGQILETAGKVLPF